MTMNTRHDGSHYPDHETENAALADMGDEANIWEGKKLTDWALGDLVADALAGLPLYRDNDEHPEAWQSFENMMLKTTALELHALARAVDAGEATTDDHETSTSFTTSDAVALLNVIRRRLAVGAELGQRLRAARWGHPCFGGGEGLAAEAREAREAVERTEEPKSQVRTARRSKAPKRRAGA